MEPKISTVRWISDITGHDVTTRWDVAGTDLGIPFYSPKQKRMYFLYGDTFGEEFDADRCPYEVNWRGTVAGYTEKLDFSEGVRWDGFLVDGMGRARTLIPARRSTNEEHFDNTKICQGGIEIDGTLYFFYEAIRDWGPNASGYWFINYGGVLKSTDGGRTLKKVYDLSWVEPTDEYGKANAKRLVEEDENLQPSGIDFDVEAHIAPGFGQMYATDGKDGYIYVYGRYGGRIHGIKVGRVRRKSFEIFNEYEYLTGFEDGVAVWKKGREGIDAILQNEEAAEVVPGPTSNMSVAYNQYLQRWMIVYYLPGEGIYYRLSETPYGPYDEAKVLLPIDHPALIERMPEIIDRNFLYGGFTNEAMMRENGRIVPFVVSQWYQWPGCPRYYGSRLFEAVFE